MSTFASAAARSHATVLLIDADEDATRPVKHWLQDRLPDAHIAHCHSLADARDYLGGAAVDLILAHNVLPDGNGLDLLHYINEQQIPTPVVVQAETLPDDSKSALRAAGALDVACAPQPSDRIARLRHLLSVAASDGRTGEGDPTLAAASGEISHLRSHLRALCDEVSRVTHDVNNPVTTISGNAQFVRELGTMMDLDPMVLKAVEDIYEASLQLTGELDRLTRLKEHLRAHVGHEQVLPS